MQAHWSASHPSITMPASLVAELETTDAERSELLKFKTASKKSKASKSRRSGAAAAPEASQNVWRQKAAHSAWVASRQ